MVSEWLNMIDIIFILIIGFSSMGGFQQGFSMQIAQVISFLTFVTLLFFSYSPIFDYVQTQFGNLHDSYISWLVMFALALLSFILFYIITTILAGKVFADISSSADHLWGLMFGLVRGVLVAVITVILLTIVGPSEIKNVIQNRSQIGSFIERELVPYVQPHLNNKSMKEIRKSFKIKRYNAANPRI